MEQKMGPPDTHYLSAAQGWVELGDLAEARNELARISPSLQEHPWVLDVKWAICAKAGDWETALKVANLQLKASPDCLSGWVHQAYSVRRTAGGGLQAAWNALFPAMEKFPKEGLVPYNLACYACQMQQLEVARILIKRAIELGDRKQFKDMAMNDPDLQPLREKIKDL